MLFVHLFQNCQTFHYSEDKCWFPDLPPVLTLIARAAFGLLGCLRLNIYSCNQSSVRDLLPQTTRFCLYTHKYSTWQLLSVLNLLRNTNLRVCLPNKWSPLDINLRLLRVSLSLGRQKTLLHSLSFRLQSSFRVRCQLVYGWGFYLSVSVKPACEAWKRVLVLCCPIACWGSTSDRFSFKVTTGLCVAVFTGSSSDFLVNGIDHLMSAIDAVADWRASVCRIWGPLIHNRTFHGDYLCFFSDGEFGHDFARDRFSFLCLLRSSKVTGLKPNDLSSPTASFHSPSLIYPATGNLSIPS